MVLQGRRVVRRARRPRALEQRKALIVPNMENGSSVREDRQQPMLALEVERDIPVRTCAADRQGHLNRDQELLQLHLRKQKVDSELSTRFREPQRT